MPDEVNFHSEVGMETLENCDHSPDDVNILVVTASATKETRAVIYESLQLGSAVDVTGGVDSSLEHAADKHSVSNGGFVENVGEGRLSHDSSLSPGMLRQFSVLELTKEAASESMTSMLKTSTLTASSNIPSVHGCGLAFLSTKLQEHYDDESKRFNKLSIRLIGAQVVSLARHSYRLVDCMKTTSETEGEKLRQLALGKIVEFLRNAGGLFNKVYCNSPGEISLLNEFCQLYFNLLALFFPESVNVTVWTVKYALPYHAKLLYDKYGTGYGMLSLQTKESNHAGIKGELSMTNRSRSTHKKGKWWQ